MALDRIDFTLLAELVTNARASHVELSERIGLSSTACARRQKMLEEETFILGYQAVLDLKRLGLSTTVLVRISLESQSEEALDAFEKAVVACPSVVRCFLMSGSDDYLVTVLARDIEDFEHIHRTQLSRLPRVARIQSASPCGRSSTGPSRRPLCGWKSEGAEIREAQTIRLSDCRQSPKMRVATEKF